ncbi:hypothetical protein BHM03_00003019 [Ensete ventricosum]|nr:hypothetical protein BHM03_00003019 [Ensete ventricosum]
MYVRGRIAGLIMTGAIELQPNDGPRSSLDIGPGFDDVVRPRWEFARRFVEGIRKLTRNTLGHHRKKTIGPATRMPEAAELSGSLAGKPPVPSFRVTDDGTACNLVLCFHHNKTWATNTTGMGTNCYPHGRLPWRNHPAAQHELPSVDERYEVGGRELRLPATVARPPRALVELQPVPNVTTDYVFYSDSVLTIGKTLRSSGRRAPRARCTTAL